METPPHRDRSPTPQLPVFANSEPSSARRYGGLRQKQQSVEASAVQAYTQFIMFCWIASIAIFGYPVAEPMNPDEPIIKLTPAGNDRPHNKGPVRLDTIQKQHYSHRARLKQTSPVPLRVIDETPAPAPEPTPAATPPPRHRAFEGKSQEYNIDEIMRPTSLDPNTIENSWDSQGKTLPSGMVAVICFCILLCATAIVMLIQRSHQVEDVQKTVKKTKLSHVETELRTAEKLVKTIEKNVRRYLLAPTIEEKLTFVRYPQEMRPLMEKYYAQNPIEGSKCDLITNLEFFTVGEKNFWKVLAIQKNQKREWIFLEQVSDTNVLIDWESHVHYQPMPWPEYVNKRPLSALDFRISLQPTAYYVGEFSDESRWVSYRVTAYGHSEVLFAFVLRHSDEHLAIESSLAQKSPYLIATLMIPPDTSVKHAVVIQKIVSDNFIRADAPKTLPQ